MTVERATKNFGWVFGLYLARRALRLGYIAAFARILHESGFGGYYLLLQIVGILVPVGLLGLGVTVTRHVSRREGDAAGFIGRAAGLGLASSTAVALLFVAVAPFLPGDADMDLAMVLIALSIVPHALIVILYSVSTGCERMGVYAVLENTTPLLEAAAGLALLLTGHGLVSLCALHAVVYTLYALAFLVLVRRRIVRFRILFDPSSWAGYLRQSWLLWVLAVQSVLATSFSVIILSAVAGNAQVGLFGVAMVPVDVIQAAAVMFGAAVFAHMVRTWHRSVDDLRQFLSTSVRLLTVLAVPVGLVATLLAGPVLTLVFGSSYAASVSVLQLLAWLVFPFFFEQIAVQVFLAAGRPGLALAGQATLNVVRIGLGAALVVGFGNRAAEGLAWAFLASSVVGFVTYALLLGHVVGTFGLWTWLGRVAAASVIPAAVAALGFGRVSPWVLAPVTVALFAVGALALKCVGAREFEVIRRSARALAPTVPRAEGPSQDAPS